MAHIPEPILTEIKAAAVLSAKAGLTGKGRRDPVLVTGMHNSGTSILAKIIGAGGVFLGGGMFHHESRFFSLLVNDWMILGGGDNWARLPVMGEDEVLRSKDGAGQFAADNWRADYMRQGYDGVSRWGFKDPRLCILLPLYLELFPGASVVHIRRDANDVAASLCEREKKGVGAMDDFGHWRDVASAYTERVVSCASRCDSYYELSYRGLCTDTEDTVLDLFDFLGLELNEKVQGVLQKVTSSRIGSFERRIRERGLAEVRA